MNKAGRRVRALRGDKLPESTGDKLTAWGDEFHLSWGTWMGLSWGSFDMLGKNALTCGLTLWGIMIYWLCSSVEPTLIPWRTEQLDCLDNSLLPLFLMLPVINPLFRMQIFMSQHIIVNAYITN